MRCGGFIDDPSAADADALRRLFDEIDEDMPSVCLALSAEAVRMAQKLWGEDAGYVLARRAATQLDLAKANRRKLGEEP